MALFPDDFPFSRRAPEPVVEPADPGPVADAPVPAEAPPAAPIETVDAPVAPVAPVAPAPVVTPVPAPEREPAVAYHPMPEPEPFEPLSLVGHVPPDRERRRSPRQTLRARATLKNDTGRGAPVPVEVDNISMLGVRFRSPHPLSLGDRANLRLEVGPLKWATRFRVITCQPDPTGAAFLIGAQFVGNELARGGWNTSAAA